MALSILVQISSQPAALSVLIAVGELRLQWYLMCVRYDSDWVQNIAPSAECEFS